MALVLRVYGIGGGYVDYTDIKTCTINEDGRTVFVKNDNTQLATMALPESQYQRILTFTPD